MTINSILIRYYNKNLSPTLCAHALRCTSTYSCTVGTLPPLRRAAGLVRDYSACLFFLAARQGAVGQSEQVMDPLANARLTLFHSFTHHFIRIPPRPHLLLLLPALSLNCRHATR